MNEEEAKELVADLIALTREVVGQELAKNGVIGKYPENFSKALERLQKKIIKSLSK